MKVYEQMAVEMPTQRSVRLRMTNLHLCGSGVFSNVYRGTLLRSEGNKEIAIKKTWPDCKREKNFEVKFLSGEGRRPHKNVISMMFIFTGRPRNGKVCESLVFEYMPETLFSLIQSTDIDILDVKLYTWQIFSALHYLSSMDVVHRDLKPVNILVDPSSGLLRISDLGSAKKITDGMKSTPYQVTRYYRPPELLLGAKHYDWSVDVWSAGCCVAEMLTKKPLFHGKDTKTQLRLVLGALGLPSAADLRAMKCNTRLEMNHRIVGSGIGKLLPHASADMVHLLTQVFVYKPKERLCGLNLLRNAFFDDVFSQDSTRSNGRPVSSVDSRDLKLAEMDELRKLERLREEELGTVKPIKSNTNIIKITSGTLSGDPDMARPPLRTIRSKASVHGNPEAPNDNNASEMRSLMKKSQYNPPK